MRVVYFFFSCSLAIAFCFTAEVKLLAETPTGKIEASAKDVEGRVVVKAKVTASNQDTGHSGQCDTDERNGSCPIIELPVGSYEVRVSSPGFKDAFKKDVQVKLAETTRVNIQLEVGQAQETVEVTSEAPTLSIDNPGTVIAAKEIHDLPLGGRDFASLVLLAPGARDGGAAAPVVGSYSLNGSRPQSTGYLLDGTTLNDPYSGGAVVGEVSPTSVSTPIPRGALLETKIQSIPKAQFGGDSGATFESATRAGSANIHGGIFYEILDDALNARDFFNFSEKKNQLRHHGFGGQLGGPLKDGKLFVFVAYEGKRDNRESTILTAVPSAADFARAVIALGGDPGVPLRQNPVVNPVIRNLLSFCFSKSTCPGGTDLWPRPAPQLQGQMFNSTPHIPSRFAFNSAFLRLDFLNPRDNVFTDYAFSHELTNSPMTLANSDPLPGMNTRAGLHTHIVTISYDRILSPASLNHVRFSWSSYSSGAVDADIAQVGNPDRSIGLNTGVANPLDFGLPQLRVHGAAFLGSSPYVNPRFIVQRQWQLEEEYTNVLGPHTLKFGYKFHRTGVDSFNDVNHRGLLEFNSLQDFLGGNVADGTISTGDSNRGTAQNIHSAFVQDDYRWTQRLSLAVGLRWEYFGVLHEDHNLLSKYDPARGLANSGEQYDASIGNYSPRLGIAWEVTDKTVLRANVGRFFDVIPQNEPTGQVQFNTFNPGIPYNALPPKPIFTSRSPSKILQVAAPVFPLSTFASDTRDVWTVMNLRSPYVFNFAVDLQQEVFKLAILQIAYVGSVGRKLSRVRDINAPFVPGGMRPFAAAAPLSTVAPNPPFVVDELESSSTSSFSSLQLTFKQYKDWHKWQNHVSWAWSHSIDDSSAGIDWTPNEALPNKLRSTVQERASSSFDQRHIVTWRSSYDFPYSGLSGWLKDWRIDGLLTLRSGQPYHVNFANEFDTEGAYDFILRPDLVGNPFLGASAPYRLLNLAAFQVPCTLDGFGTTVSHCLPGTLHFGNLRRNAFVGPGIGKFDMGVSKTIRLRRREKVFLQIRADALNLTNHPIFASPLLPRYIALASLKGIGLNGRGGAAGASCSTRTASVDCYLPAPATPDGALGSPSEGMGARTVQISARFSF